MLGAPYRALSSGVGGSAIRSLQAVVRHQGNAGLLRALELSVLAVHQGAPLHLHAQGVRGTGKTTVLRCARSVLPPIRRIRGCPYQCDPTRPHCPAHRHLPADQLEALGAETVPMPLFEISHSATVGTVVGSIDLKRLTAASEPSAALLPGTLARAHRGIVLIDEINRLVETAPALTDVLLDVMGTRPGRLQIEETGLERVTLPVSLAVWATSNPDEDPGPLEEIRRQLADRFDLVVNVRRPRSRTDVEAILRRAGAGGGWQGTGSRAEGSRGEDEGGELRSRLARRAAGARPTMPARLRESLASAYVQFDLESLRAVEAMQLAAVMAAQADGQSRVTGAHLIEVVPWALNHRVGLDRLTDVTEFLREACGQTGGPDGAGARGNPAARAAAGPRTSDPGGAAGEGDGSRSGDVPGFFGRRLKAWLDRLPLPGLPERAGTGQAGPRSHGRQAQHAPPPPDAGQPIRSLPPERWLGPETARERRPGHGGA